MWLNWKKGAANIFVDSYRQTRFEGVVTAVGPQAVLSTRAFPVEVTVVNARFQLKAGMIVRIEVTSRTIENAPLLPKSALLVRSGQTLIFVIEDGKAVPRTPRLGLEVGDTIAVLEGVEAGEEVVVLGQENLAQGVRVEVKSRHRGNLFFLNKN